MVYNDGFELLFALGTKKHPVAPQPHHASISQDFTSRDARGEIAPCFRSMRGGLQSLFHGRQPRVNSSTTKCQEVSEISKDMASRCSSHSRCSSSMEPRANGWTSCRNNVARA